ncbi:MAG: DUF5017 domain-containing protein [Mangrovibacterium sp.]
MKHIYNALAIIVLMTIMSCKDDIEIPSFDVSTSETTYQEGEKVVFNFSGNPDFITFFSGESGKKYENRNRVSGNGIPKMQFTSLSANGTQTNTLFLMISDDFTGVVDGDDVATASNISKATWTDITSRAVLSTGTSVSSGAVDLSDFTALGKPMYIAFKYLSASGSIQRKWTISNLTINNVLPDATYTIANLTTTAITNYGVANIVSPGWGACKISYTTWTIGTTMVITGATTAAAATIPAEAWAICGPVYLDRVAPDTGMPLKGMDSRLESYTYTYNTEGTYHVTFVGANNNVYGNKEILKEIHLTVVP